MIKENTHVGEQVYLETRNVNGEPESALLTSWTKIDRKSYARCETANGVRLVRPEWLFKTKEAYYSKYRY